MRKIKFRVWDKKANKMHYSNKFMIKADGTLLYNKKAVECGDEYYNEIKYLNENRYEIMQYIGLNDKNGKEIYEEDILIDCEGEKWFVFYDNTCGWYRLKSCYNDEVIEDIPDNLTSDNKLDMKIIGNKYENPELLKGDKNERD